LCQDPTVSTSRTEECSPCTYRSQNYRTKNHGDRKPTCTGNPLPYLYGEDDVADPKHTGHEGEEHTDYIEVRTTKHRFGAQDSHSSGRSGDPDKVTPVA